MNILHPTTGEKVYPLAEALELLAQAQADHAVADGAERAAKLEATAALNRVNELQRAVDNAVAAIRTEAPASSDWGNQRLRRYEVAR